VNQRIVLWGALGALVVAAAGGAVVLAGGDDAEDTPRLPLAMAGAEGSAEAPSSDVADAAAVGIAPIEYVAGDGLPALGGVAPAYRLPVDVPAERVAELAAALGLSGEPGSTGDGSWHVEDGDRRLDVYGPGNTWASYTLVALDAPVSSDGSVGSPPAAGANGEPDAGTATAGGGASPMEGSAPAGEPAGAVAPTTIVCVQAPCEPPADDTAPPATTGPAPAESATTVPGSPEPGSTEPAPATDVPPCVPGPAVLCPAGAPIADEPVPGLPSEDEATVIATEMLEAAGIDVAGARTRTSGGIGEWYVEVEPALDGIPAPGLASSVSVGPDGVVPSASGPVAIPAELGDYALLSTAEAIDRLNEAGSVWATGGGAAGAAEDAVSTEIAPQGQPAEAIPTTGTAPQGLRQQGDVPARTPGGPPMTPGTALPPDPTIAPPDDASAPTNSVTTVPATTVPGDPGTPPTEPAVPPTSVADPGGPGPTVTPGPADPAPAQRITLTEVELVLIAVPSWDDSGTYLVPGYRFTDGTGIQATIPAVVDASLLPPD